MPVERYLATCWNCLGEFDALAAVWCSDDPKNPTKLCPFCFHCFCEASEKYKEEFWRGAPGRLIDDLQTLNRSKDRLGDLLIRMKKITTPQLLEALGEQKNTDKRLGTILVERRLVSQEDIDTALRTQGAQPLTDTLGVAYSAAPVWEHSAPEAIVHYILTLAAKKGASDVHIEPTEDAIAVKYRIDGFFYRVDPIPKSCQEGLTLALHEALRLKVTVNGRPQTGRTTARIADANYDLVSQTLPTSHGVSSTIKLINRATFLKDFSTLGLEIEDRVRLLEEIKRNFGLVLVTAPVFNGANTTAYSIMNFLVEAQRDVVSLEAPVLWPIEGARQVEVEAGPGGLRVEETLRSVVAVRPEVVMLFSVPDRATAMLAAQLAASILVVAVLPAQTAGQGVTALLGLGVPPQTLANALAGVTCQRLVRQICRICRAPAEPPAPQTLASHGVGPEEAATLQFFKGQGCPSCNKVGFRGRRAIFEVMNGVPEVRNGILNGIAAPDIESMAIGAGMMTIRDRCLHFVRTGVTTFDEFVRLRL